MRQRLSISVVLLAWSVALHAQPLIVLDAGHEPSKPGAVATCGNTEVTYNDAVVGALAAALADYRIVLTRNANADVATEDPAFPAHLSAAAKAKWPTHRSLLTRAALANAQHADLFISIHHDSTPTRNLVTDATLCNGRGGKKLADAFKRRYRVGYNLFVNDDAPEPKRSASLALARLLGLRLQAAARTAADYHRDDCPSCRAIAAELGIWHHDLAVLRYTDMPALLIEVGNLLDVDDEAQVSSAAFRRQFADHVKMAVDDYFSAPQHGAPR